MEFIGYARLNADEEIFAKVQNGQKCFQDHSYWFIIKDSFAIKSSLQIFLAIMFSLFRDFTGTDSLKVSPS